MTKKRSLLVLVLMPLVAGCSMMGLKKPDRIIGSWTAIHESGVEVILEFKPDRTMSCTVPDASEYSFAASYSIDYSNDPAAVDFTEITGSQIPSFCRGIVKFSGEDRMIFLGRFRDSGDIIRPENFESSSADMGDVYLEFKKTTK